MDCYYLNRVAGTLVRARVQISRGHGFESQWERPFAMSAPRHSSASSGCTQRFTTSTGCRLGTDTAGTPERSGDRVIARNHPIDLCTGGQVVCTSPEITRPSVVSIDTGNTWRIRILRRMRRVNPASVNWGAAKVRAQVPVTFDLSIVVEQSKSHRNCSMTWTF